MSSPSVFVVGATRTPVGSYAGARVGVEASRQDGICDEVMDSVLRVIRRSLADADSSVTRLGVASRIDHHADPSHGPVGSNAEGEERQP